MSQINDFIRDHIILPEELYKGIKVVDFLMAASALKERSFTEAFKLLDNSAQTFATNKVIKELVDRNNILTNSLKTLVEKAEALANLNVWDASSLNKPLLVVFIGLSLVLIYLIIKYSIFESLTRFMQRFMPNWLNIGNHDLKPAIEKFKDLLEKFENLEAELMIKKEVIEDKNKSLNLIKEIIENTRLNNSVVFGRLRKSQNNLTEAFKDVKHFLAIIHYNQVLGWSRQQVIGYITMYSQSLKNYTIETHYLKLHKAQYTKMLELIQFVEGEELKTEISKLEIKLPESEKKKPIKLPEPEKKMPVNTYQLRQYNPMSLATGIMGNSFLNKSTTNTHKELSLMESDSMFTSSINSQATKIQINAFIEEEKRTDFPEFSEIKNLNEDILANIKNLIFKKIKTITTELCEISERGHNLETLSLSAETNASLLLKRAKEIYNNNEIVYRQDFCAKEHNDLLQNLKLAQEQFLEILDFTSIGVAQLI